MVSGREQDFHYSGAAGDGAQIGGLLPAANGLASLPLLSDGGFGK